MTSDTTWEPAPIPFGPAHDVLRSVTLGRHDDAHENGAIPEETREAALSLLAGLGYHETAEDGRSFDRMTGEDRNLDNRLRLLALAARLDRTFHLPMRHAPGAFFLGAMVSPERFSIAGHPAAGVGGRGLTLGQAFESCVGEAAEYLSFIARDDESTCERGVHDGLDGNDLAWVAAGLGLEGKHQLDDLDWMVARSIAEDRSVKFPADLVLRRPAASRKTLREAESTGVGAGPTREAAILSGLLEAIERDAIGLWWHGGAPARPVSADLTDDPEFERFMTGLRGDSGRIWWLLDITSDLGVPTCAALSAEWNGRAVVAGFCSRPDFRSAALGAVLEMCQMELAQELALGKLSRQGEAALSRQDRLWIARAHDLSLESAPQLHARASPGTDMDFPVDADPLAAIVTRLRDRGYNSYVVDLTRPDLAIPVVRVIVPGLQSVKPDWVTSRLIAQASDNDHPLDRIGESTAPI